MTISKEVTAKMNEARNLIIEAAKTERVDGWVANDMEMFRVLNQLRDAVIHQSKANGMTAEEIAGWTKMDVMDVHVILAQPLVLPVGVGAIVRPKNERDIMHCGSSQYAQAVVVQMDPFVMVSQSGDMRWGTWTADRVTAVAMADKETLERCMERLKD